jgi:hypothetical protein
MPTQEFDVVQSAEVGEYTVKYVFFFLVPLPSMCLICLLHAPLMRH